MSASLAKRLAAGPVMQTGYKSWLPDFAATAALMREAAIAVAESEIEAIQGSISAIEYGGNTGTRQSAPDALAELAAEIEELRAFLRTLRGGEA